MNPHKDKALAPLLVRPDLWQASSLTQNKNGINTGFGALNDVLHQGGWPKNGLLEVLPSHWGSAELMLLTPCLAQLSQLPGLLVLIAPPYIPYAPALQQQGVNLQRIIIVHPRSTPDLLWCTEQALVHSGNSVISWLGSPDISYRQLRKLQLASRKTPGLSALIRPHYSARQNSPSHLRLSLSASQSSLQVHILKQQGGWAGQQVQLKTTLPGCHRQIKASQLPVHRTSSYSQQQPCASNPLPEMALSKPNSSVPPANFTPRTIN